MDGALNAGASSQAGGEEGARAAVSHMLRVLVPDLMFYCSCLQLNRRILEASNPTQSRAALKQATNSLISGQAWKGTSNAGPLFAIVQLQKITGHQQIAAIILALVVAIATTTVSAGRSDPRQRRRGGPGSRTSTKPPCPAVRRRYDRKGVLLRSQLLEHIGQRRRGRPRRTTGRKDSLNQGSKCK